MMNFITVLTLLFFNVQVEVSGNHVENQEFPDSFTGKNFLQPSLNDHFWKDDTESLQLSVNFTRMAEIELMLSQSSSNQTSSLGFKDSWEWTQLVLALQIEFDADLCASGFSSYRGEWYTCCYLHNLVTAMKVGVCGSNRVLKLPVPCRKPKKKFDYNNGFNQTLTVDPSTKGNEYNHEKWACPTAGSVDMSSVNSSTSSGNLNTASISDRTLGSYDLQQSREHVAITKKNMGDHNYLPSLTRQAVDGVPVFRFDLSENAKTSNACSLEMLQFSCFAFCCDSCYRDSKFCQDPDLLCY